ncbi:hypothetical protein OsI_38260 [Oryza sativa Indica Group]|uniref:Uncharacterized protein n=1 Tax=Oryza sativa subsp. indica TaxID=39946 RepID=B8BPJ3_ORYSI|nr:hypothetical protein OsI_38260 [Oryza sativa Indica Group]
MPPSAAPTAISLSGRAGLPLPATGRADLSRDTSASLPSPTTSSSSADRSHAYSRAAAMPSTTGTTPAPATVARILLPWLSVAHGPWSLVAVWPVARACRSCGCHLQLLSVPAAQASWPWHADLPQPHQTTTHPARHPPLLAPSPAAASRRPLSCRLCAPG